MTRPPRCATPGGICLLCLVALLHKLGSHPFLRPLPACRRQILHQEMSQAWMDSKFVKPVCVCVLVRRAQCRSSSARWHGCAPLPLHCERRATRGCISALQCLKATLITTVASLCAAVRGPAVGRGHRPAEPHPARRPQPAGHPGGHQRPPVAAQVSRACLPVQQARPGLRHAYPLALAVRLSPPICALHPPQAAATSPRGGLAAHAARAAAAGAPAVHAHTRPRPGAPAQHLRVRTCESGAAWGLRSGRDGAATLGWACAFTCDAQLPMRRLVRPQLHSLPGPVQVREAALPTEQWEASFARLSQVGSGRACRQQPS